MSNSEFKLLLDKKATKVWMRRLTSIGVASVSAETDSNYFLDSFWIVSISYTSRYKNPLRERFSHI